MRTAKIGPDLRLIIVDSCSFSSLPAGWFHKTVFSQVSILLGKHLHRISFCVTVPVSGCSSGVVPACRGCHGYLHSAHCIWQLPLTFKALAPMLIVSNEFNSHNHFSWLWIDIVRRKLMLVSRDRLNNWQWQKQNKTNNIKTQVVSIFLISYSKYLTLCLVSTLVSQNCKTILKHQD